MVEYEYRTEETEIMEYTEGLRNVLKNPEKYKAIFDCFKKEIYRCWQKLWLQWQAL